MFIAEFNTWEAGAQVDEWLDKEVLKLDRAKIEHVELAGADPRDKDKSK